jgi:hypothetical protein
MDAIQTAVRSGVGIDFSMCAKAESAASRYVRSACPSIPQYPTRKLSLARTAIAFRRSQLFTVTIAVCYVSPEGIVLGADSTSSYVLPTGGMHYYNHAQKLFEVGESATIGIITWGAAGISETRSYRSLVATLADGLQPPNAPPDMLNVTQRWIDLFWAEYTTTQLYHYFQGLHVRPGYDPAAQQQAENARSAAEEQEYLDLADGLVAGFCVAGYVLPNRTAEAFAVTFDPLQGKPVPTVVTRFGFWGAPNFIERLVVGRDPGLISAVLESPHWTGSQGDLEELLRQFILFHPIIPMREAIDFVHTCIYSTIKSLKFSNFSQTCGGPIELAAITTDRKFRWVRHKSWDVAITEGAPT